MSYGVSIALSAGGELAVPLIALIGKSWLHWAT
jgi:hypothetical protein